MDGLKRYVNDDRFRVDGDKNMRLLAFAFTIVFVWTGSKNVFSLKFETGCYTLACAHKISQNSKKRILQDPSLET